MRDSDYVMYLWMETEKKRKEKEALKKMIQKRKSDVDFEGEKGKDQHISVEKTNIDKEYKKDINEKATNHGATVDNIEENVGIYLSCGPKRTVESTDESVNEDDGTSHQQHDVVQIPSQTKRQKLVNEDIGTSNQENIIAQEKLQKME